MNTKSSQLLALSIGVALGGAHLSAQANPFQMTELGQGYMVSAEDKGKEGKCGGAKPAEGDKGKEGKCGGAKPAEEEKGKEGKCGGAKPAEGDKGKEGKCGGAKPAEGDKGKEGKCGEGKCGGTK